MVASSNHLDSRHQPHSGTPPAPAANVQQRSRRAIQRSLAGTSFAEGEALLAPRAAAVQASAAHGVSGASQQLPHFAAIQRAFGRHDVSAVQAQVGGAAGQACDALGASAYASGNRVAFEAAPDLHTAAHEAAHVVQQRAGVQLSGGVGQRGDRYEQHADAVADAVVAGRSAESLLDGQAGGGAAQAGAGVQFYAKKSGHYTTQINNGTDIPMFTNELANPQLEGEGAETRIAYDRQNVDKPMMRFSNDDTAGVQATKRADPLKGDEQELTHSKDLYITENVLAHSNQDLAGVESMVRLVPTGHQIVRGGNTLLGVKPGIADEESAQTAQEMVNLRTNICIELAKQIISGDQGYSTYAVLDNGAGNRSLAKISSNGTESAQVSKLGQHLGQGGGGSHDEARDVMTPGNPVTPGESYGTAIRGGGLDEQTRELGVNKHAKPNVGEGYGTYTMAGPGVEHAKTDYSVLTQDQPTERDQIWGYHYAGVVAQSEDGRDNVTLENYNRRSDVTRAKKQLLDKLKQDFGQVLDEVAALGAQDNANTADARLREAYAKIHEVQGAGARDAEEMFVAATRPDNNNAWFFAMYGSNQGQSFHEKMAKSGAFANPLTVRVSNELTRAIEPLRRELVTGPQLPGPLAQDPAFETLGRVRGAIADAADSAASVAQIRASMEPAVAQYRDYLRNAVWTAIGNLLEHTGVNLPDGVPASFDALRAALGHIAEQLEAKSNRFLTRQRSNDRRAEVRAACHTTIEWLTATDAFLDHCLGMF